MNEDKKVLIVNRALSSFQWITVITFATALLKIREVDWKVLAGMIVISMMQDYTRR